MSLIDSIKRKFSKENNPIDNQLVMSPNMTENSTLSNEGENRLKSSFPIGSKGFRIGTSDDFEKEASRVKISLPRNTPPIGLGTSHNYSLQEVERYVQEHTSGAKSEQEYLESGSMIVSFPQFMQMVEEDANIYYSQVLNENCISIKYQKGLWEDNNFRKGR